MKGKFLSVIESLMHSPAADYGAFGELGINPGGPITGPVIASAAGLIAAPTAKVHHVSGTAAITLIPLPYAGFQGTIIFIPDAIFTGATGGVATATNFPIGLAFTAVVGKPLHLTFDGSFWYPSYTA